MYYSLHKTSLCLPVAYRRDPQGIWNAILLTDSYITFGKIRFDVILALIIQLNHKFSNVTTAELLWHVQSRGMILSSIM